MPLARITTPLMMACLAVLLTLTLTLTVCFSKEITVDTSYYSACIEAPALPIPTTNVVTVGTTDKLYEALSNQRDGSTILIRPGTYHLAKTILAVTADNVTVRGLEDNCDSVHLVGPGMDNPNLSHGFRITSQNTTIANLTISDVYYHTIQIDPGSNAPTIYNVRMVDSGQQFVKSNPIGFENGVDNGVVVYSIMEYTNGPSQLSRDGSGTGYTNGVDIHAGKGWRISNNRFNNFHTPDNADFLWNAAVLAWNGASDTITENNVFINVNRAVAYGLRDRDHDHRGGIIRNNKVIIEKDLYSTERREFADASIIAWDSPGILISHNTILTNGNTPLAIELRFDSDNSEVSNNITDAAISHRDKAVFKESNNINNAKEQWFADPTTGKFQLKENYNQITAPNKK